MPFAKGFLLKYSVKRPFCPACQQRLCAVNYYANGVPHYRSRCEYCIKRSRKVKPPVPRWQASGYKKKPTCDRCGFKAKHSAQLLVYHIDGNLHHTDAKNLRTICQNCTVEVMRLGLPWRPGDLEPDR